MQSQGNKHDKGKLRYDLVDPLFEQAIAEVLTQGAEEYGEFNWRKVKPFIDRYYAATRRHLSSFILGERTDKKSGCSHLAHAACNLMFLHWYERGAKDNENTDIQRYEINHVVEHSNSRENTEHSVCDDDETELSRGEWHEVRKLAGILAEVGTYESIRARCYGDDSGERVEVISGPNNTTPHDVSYIRVSTLSKLCRLSDRLAPQFTSRPASYK